MNELSHRFRHFVGGAFREGPDAMEVLNPATEKALGGAPEADEAMVDEAVRSAAAAQPAWAHLPAIERAKPLRALAQAIRGDVSRIARIIAAEQGKVLPLAEMEVFITAEYLDYSAEWARRIEGEVITSDRPGEHMFLFRRPMGVVAGILPWNFPFFVIARKMAPALITGNTIVVKPSEETPYSAHAFAEIAAASGLPDGVFGLVNGRGATTGRALVRHPGVDMISFTGSSAAGAQIMADASMNLTKVNLELGGKAPAIVLDDATIDLAVGTLKASKALNSGQACNCAERIYVDRRIAAEFKEKLAAAMGSIKSGDPLGDVPIEMGPLVNKDAVERLQAMVGDAREKGAEVLTGGSAHERGGGFHFEPTVIAGTSKDMHVSSRELFGPVVLVDEIDGLDEGIARANDSEYGLTSSVFTNNLNAAMKAINELKFGETYVNRENFEAIQGFHAGVRRSGIGGTDGKHGLYEYTHTQVAYIQT
jgi:lactaldehyde dehydrogenase/glycolaldehyde dehydrogenase